MSELAPTVASIAYDRPGFGETSIATSPFSSVEHLLGVVDSVADQPVVLVGNSQGGRIALDFTRADPERVAGLVLVATAVSGAPEIDWVAELGQQLVDEIEAAEDAGAIDVVNRHEAAIWLDGPRQPEGRVGGATRELFLDMNGIALVSDTDAVAPEVEPPDIWGSLDEIVTPMLVMTGEHDVIGVTERCRALSQRSPNATIIELSGVAHVPQLEQPRLVADHIRHFVASLAHS